MAHITQSDRTLTGIFPFLKLPLEPRQLIYLIFLVDLPVEGFESLYQLAVHVFGTSKESDASDTATDRLEAMFPDIPLRPIPSRGMLQYLPLSQMYPAIVTDRRLYRYRRTHLPLALAQCCRDIRQEMSTTFAARRQIKFSCSKDFIGLTCNVCVRKLAHQLRDVSLVLHVGSGFCFPDPLGPWYLLWLRKNGLRDLFPGLRKLQLEFRQRFAPEYWRTYCRHNPKGLQEQVKLVTSVLTMQLGSYRAVKNNAAIQITVKGLACPEDAEFIANMLSSGRAHARWPMKVAMTAFQDMQDNSEADELTEPPVWAEYLSERSIA